MIKQIGPFLVANGSYVDDYDGPARKPSSVHAFKTDDENISIAMRYEDNVSYELIWRNFGNYGLTTERTRLLWSNNHSLLVREYFHVIKEHIFDTLLNSESGSVALPYMPYDGMFFKTYFEKVGDDTLVFNVNENDFEYGKTASRTFNLVAFNRASFSLKSLLIQYHDWWAAYSSQFSSKLDVRELRDVWYIINYDITYHEAVAALGDSDIHRITGLD